MVLLILVLINWLISTTLSKINERIENLEFHNVCEAEKKFLKKERKNAKKRRL